MTDTNEKQFRIYSLASNQNETVMFLEEVKGPKLFPLRIGPFEGEAIALKFSGIALPRPFTHDLLYSAIETLGGKVKKIVIDRSENNTYYCCIYAEQNGNMLVLDSRPSDAIALAVRAACPILISEEVLKTAQTLQKPITSEEAQDLKEKIRNIKPEDIINDLKAGNFSDDSGT